MCRNPRARLLAAALSLATVFARGENAPAIVKSEFIYEHAPFPSCHASTIAETPAGLVCAWFGGSAEGKPDVGIWLSRREGEAWSAPVEIANGMQSDSPRQPAWNPVLFQAKDGPLVLFYKVGPTPDHWWGMMMTSADSGRTWSASRKLPDGFLGPIKNKALIGPDGALWCPSSSEDAGWRSHLEFTSDLGATWRKTAPLNDAAFGTIQPTILFWPHDRVQLLVRTQNRGVIGECWSPDAGKTWEPMRATALPNPNSGLDAVMLRDGRALLIYNHTPKGRTPLNLAFSRDGVNWQPALVLESEPGEYSYPAIIQTADGLIHATYTWHRERIRHVVIDPAKLHE